VTGVIYQTELMMLIDEHDEDWKYQPDPTDPWWLAWGDVIAFGVLSVSLTTLALYWLWQ
jgi:hypothetical protein